MAMLSSLTQYVQRTACPKKALTCLLQRVRGKAVHSPRNAGEALKTLQSSEHVSCCFPPKALQALSLEPSKHKSPK